MTIFGMCPEWIVTFRRNTFLRSQYSSRSSQILYHQHTVCSENMCCFLLIAIYFGFTDEKSFKRTTHIQPWIVKIKTLKDAFEYTWFLLHRLPQCIILIILPHKHVVLQASLSLFLPFTRWFKIFVTVSLSPSHIHIQSRFNAHTIYREIRDAMCNCLFL